MKIIKTIAIFLLLIPLKFYGQCLTFSIQTTPSSCMACYDGTACVVDITGGCPPFYSFAWGGGYQLGPCTTELSWGSYSVLISVPDSCCNQSDTIAYGFVNYLTGIFDSQDSLHIKTFINDNNLLIIESLNGEKIIELFDIIGNKIFNSINTNSKFEINLNSLNKQIYILIVRDKNKGIVYRDKIIL